MNVESAGTSGVAGRGVGSKLGRGSAAGGLAVAPEEDGGVNGIASRLGGRLRGEDAGPSSGGIVLSEGGGVVRSAPPGPTPSVSKEALRSSNTVEPARSSSSEGEWGFASMQARTACFAKRLRRIPGVSSSSTSIWSVSWSALGRSVGS